jgi:hypothetical protein
MLMPLCTGLDMMKGRPMNIAGGRVMSQQHLRSRHHACIYNSRCYQRDIDGGGGGGAQQSMRCRSHAEVRD